MKDSRDEPKLLGIIDLSTEELIIEDCYGRINFPNGIGECKIYVYSNEGTIPHFHLIKDKFESCICIYESLYFNHGLKQSRLNSKQRKILNNWLDLPSIPNPKISNWDMLHIAWYGGNGDKYIPKNPSKPNYTNMENMRSN